MSSISTFTLQVKRLEAKIEKLETRPEKIARRARIERFETRLDNLLDNAPQDEFSISLDQPFPEAQPDFWSYTIDITDSPYDDTFTGGDPLWFQVRGNGRQSEQGGSGGFNRRSSLANGDYWEGNESQSFMTGSNWYADDHQHPELTATLGIEKPTGDAPLWVEEIDTYAFGNVNASCIWENAQPPSQASSMSGVDGSSPL